MEAYRYLAQVYDKLMGDVDYAAWAAYLHGFLTRFNAERVFETACGTGDITEKLYDYGYDIAASDISEEMLRIAMDKARKSGRSIQYLKQDMRHMETGRRVDAILCACDGLNYVDIEGAALFAKSAYQCLKPGGALLFDISTRYKLKCVMDGQVYFDDGEDTTCIWKNCFDDMSGTLRMDVTLFVRRGDLFERYSERHVQYAHENDKLKQCMLSAGFTRVDVLDGFTENVVSETSQRAQFVCVRP